MKKSIAILSVLATSAAFAATTVDSGNTFGFVPVTTASTGVKPVLTCVAVPVNGYTTGTSIKIAEVLQVTDLTVGDKLYTMEGGKYNEYTLTLKEDKKTWAASRIVTVGAKGEFVEQGGTPPNEATIAPRGAFWLQTSATRVSLMGDATEQARAATISAGWQLIGNPSITDTYRISDIPGTIGDVLQTSSTAYRYVKIDGDSVWATGSGKTWTPANNVFLKPGEGALLYSQAGSTGSN